jgi:hypothetical protein
VTRREDGRERNREFRFSRVRQVSGIERIRGPLTRILPQKGSMRRPALFLLVAACVLQPHLARAQGLTGALIGTVRDAQGGVLAGAVVRVSSPALIGGPATLTTNEKGQLRFLALPPGPYVLDIEFQGLTTYHEEGIDIGIGATIERTAVLTLPGLAESVVVEGAGSRIEARDPGFGTRFGPADLKAIPTRRSSMFDFIRAAPGVSPTSPGSATATTVSGRKGATSSDGRTSGDSIARCRGRCPTAEPSRCSSSPVPRPDAVSC